ncbi:unnamed protein product [Chrysoparadoxa australica]
MPRTAYELSTLEGFRTPKLCALAVAGEGEKVIAGSSDGAVTCYTYRASAAGATRECTHTATVQKPRGSKVQCVQHLLAVEAWGAILALSDGGELVAYNLQTSVPLASIPDARGASCFCVDEVARLLYVGSKKRLLVFSWQGVNAQLRREIALPETPSALEALVGSDQVVGALLSEYGVVNATTGVLTPVLLLSESGSVGMAMPKVPIMLPLPACDMRGARLLLSSGSRGLLIDMAGANEEERLSWSAPPLAARHSAAFLLATLPFMVQIHDLSSLAPVQAIDISGAVCMAGCSLKRGTGELIYVGTSGGTGAGVVNLLNMVPMRVQVERLVEAGSFEEALALCSMCRSCGNEALLQDIDVESIHHKYGHEMLGWGDAEGAVGQFLLANTPLEDVVQLFAQLIPQELLSSGMIKPSSEVSELGVSARVARGQSISRAAAALVKFLEARRPAVMEAANRAEMQGGSSSSQSVKAAVLLDTMLTSAYMHSNPPRRDAIVTLVSDGNSRASLEACAPLLAAGGVPAAEALLWLYRCAGQHRRALSLLQEDRCTGAGGWSLEQFEAWTAEYLHTLWCSAVEGHPQLAMQAAKPLLVKDPALGLSIFGAGDGSSSASSPQPQLLQVVEYLKLVQPSPRRQEALIDGDEVPLTTGELSELSELSACLCDGCLMQTKGLTSSWLTSPGRALAIAFIEQLIKHRSPEEVPKHLHDELACLLMEGLLAEQEKGGGPLADVYRKRLRAFLSTSTLYNPARLLSVVPSHFLHEHALLLSRLGRHQEVLSIYVRQLKDNDLAEEYCERIYQEEKANAADEPELPGRSSSVGSVYGCLLQVYLSLEGDEAFQHAVSLLERCFDRIDAVEAVSALPLSLPVNKLQRYLCSALRHYDSTFHSTQIAHQLLRAEYVNVKNEVMLLQSRVSQVPELALSFAHLGRMLRSCPPIELTDAAAEVRVACVKHILEAHVVLQWNITSTLRDQRLCNVSVHAESSEPELFSVKTERALQVVPPGGGGSCYTVLGCSQRGVKAAVTSSIACELRFKVVPEGGGGGGYTEEIPLEDVEIHADELR